MRARSRRPLACHHEAGHAVACWWLGFVVEDVAVLGLDDLRAGATLLDQHGHPRRVEGLVNAEPIHLSLPRLTLSALPEASRPAFARRAEVRCEMALVDLFAGTYAEARFTRRSVSLCSIFGAEDDVAEAQRIAAEWFDVEEDRRAAFVRAERIAGAMVRSPKGWAAIQAVAGALLDCGTFDGEEVDALCATAYGVPFAYDRWAEAWPPTPAQIRAGFLSIAENGGGAGVRLRKVTP